MNKFIWQANLAKQLECVFLCNILGFEGIVSFSLFFAKPKITLVRYSL